jgi:hypothetical protein
MQAPSDLATHALLSPVHLEWEAHGKPMGSPWEGALGRLLSDERTWATDRRLNDATFTLLFLPNSISDLQFLAEVVRSPFMQGYLFIRVSLVMPFGLILLVYLSTL